MNHSRKYSNASIGCIIHTLSHLVCFSVSVLRCPFLSSIITGRKSRYLGVKLTVWKASSFLLAWSKSQIGPLRICMRKAGPWWCGDGLLQPGLWAWWKHRHLWCYDKDWWVLHTMSSLDLMHFGVFVCVCADVCLLVCVLVLLYLWEIQNKLASPYVLKGFV